MHCWLRAIPSVLPLFRLQFFRSLLMSEWCEVTRHAKKSQGWRAQSGLRVPECQCVACKTRSFLSRSTCRGCNDEDINEWSQTAAWPQHFGDPPGMLLTL